jgi:predicted acylesterase/phospholipase RssA
MPRVSILYISVNDCATTYVLYSAVMTVREGGKSTAEVDPIDFPILFRSYNHRRRYRPTSHKMELNPRTLESSVLSIHEACAATSAAPTYFHPVYIKGRKYIDGGVHANNPAVYAWNEARQMSTPRTDHMTGDPYALVSIGTGKSENFDRVNLRSLVSFAIKKIVDTEEAHQSAMSLTQQAGRVYFRFNVPGYPENEGLAKINMTSCEKIKKPHTQPVNQQSMTGDMQQLAQEEDERLQQEVAEQHPGGFKPSKYKYVTFDRIRERTIAYCYSNRLDSEEPVINRITNCAEVLRGQSLKRRELERNRPKGALAVRSFEQFRNPQFSD